MLKASVVGASGYSGGELVRLLSEHSQVELGTLTASSQQGLRIDESFRHLRGYGEQELVAPDWEALGRESDVVFLGLPHGLSMDGAGAILAGGAKVVDIGADFRLDDASLYGEWYDLEHTAPELLSEAAYGIPELYGEAIAKARLVACAGCYPTASVLAMAPIVSWMASEGVASQGPVIVDAKSGVSGAGRAASMGTHYSEVNENVKPYKTGSHRHMPEIEQTLGKLGCSSPVFFSPHLVPMTRGILSACYLTPDTVPSQAEAEEIYREFYADSRFVRVRASAPETKATAGSNYCDVAVCVDVEKGLVVAMSAIDNLVKGASGQAIQCMNLMFDLPEEEGLCQAPLYP